MMGKVSATDAFEGQARKTQGRRHIGAENYITQASFQVSAFSKLHNCIMTCPYEWINSNVGSLWCILLGGVALMLFRMKN